MLPNDVLLAIFDFCVNESSYSFPFPKKEIEAWLPLVHVCRQWRNVVFGSPRRLRLRLVCATKAQTPVRESLNFWPPFPLIIQGSADRPEEFDNITAALERNDRVCEIALVDVSSSNLANLSAAMQKPFPELTFLSLSSSEVATAISDSLFESAPRLQILWLSGIPFPGLPKLLSFATHIVNVQLFDIPYLGYFSPEAIITALSTLTSLNSFRLEFRSPRSRPNWASRRPPPPSRSILPFLTTLRFKGVSEYLEDLVTRIDAPRLHSLDITLFNQIEFDAPKTIQFIRRTRALTSLEEARLVFKADIADIRLSSQTSGSGIGISVRILCRELDWQVSSLEQVCTSCLPPLSTLEDLYIYENTNSPPDWKGSIENTLWLELLSPFTTVKNLYLSENFALRIAPVMQELVGDRTTEAFPTLENIFLEGLQPSGPLQEGIAKFVAARQLSDHPITVYFWKRDH